MRLVFATCCSSWLDQCELCGEGCGLTSKEIKWFHSTTRKVTGDDGRGREILPRSRRRNGSDLTRRTSVSGDEQNWYTHGLHWWQDKDHYSEPWTLVIGLQLMHWY
jgi:hypothetical protein